MALSPAGFLGSHSLPYGINYNQTWHQAGAVGRFFSLGAKYSF